jgi:hypothetical protein
VAPSRGTAGPGQTRRCAVAVAARAADPQGALMRDSVLSAPETEREAGHKLQPASGHRTPHLYDGAPGQGQTVSPVQASGCDAVQSAESQLLASLLFEPEDGGHTFLRSNRLAFSGSPASPKFPCRAATSLNRPHKTQSQATPRSSN